MTPKRHLRNFSSREILQNSSELIINHDQPQAGYSSNSPAYTDQTDLIQTFKGWDFSLTSSSLSFPEDPLSPFTYATDDWKRNRYIFFYNPFLSKQETAAWTKMSAYLFKKLCILDLFNVVTDVITTLRGNCLTIQKASKLNPVR